MSNLHINVLSGTRTSPDEVKACHAAVSYLENTFNPLHPVYINVDVEMYSMQPNIWAE